MNAVNPANERAKRRYFEYQRETLGLAEATIDHAAAAIYDFEQFTGCKDFKRWSLKQALAYKKQVMAAASKRSGAVTSRATVVSKLRLVKNFFLWLATQPGYRSNITRAEVEYLAPTRHDARLAAVPSGRPAPTLEQARHVILSMPATTDVELRNRAVMACALLTGARVSALITLKLKHVMADRLGIEQDAREVRTKGSKTQTTFFFPVGDDLKNIFLSYVDHLCLVLHWGTDEPLFPATEQTCGADHQFHVSGLKREHWHTPDPVRTICRRAYAAAGVRYFSPHAFRNCLINWAEQSDCSYEQLKAFSLNLGHDELLTSLISYGGGMTSARRAELLIEMACQDSDDAKAAALGKAILQTPKIAELFQRLTAKAGGQPNDLP
ncbi:MAG: site-specific integrase [Croceibacterium sp.]